MRGLVSFCLMASGCAFASSLLAGLPPFVKTQPHELDILIESGHNQGADCSEEGIYLGHQLGVELVDWEGKHVRHVDTPAHAHMGDVAYADGKVYGVITLRGKDRIGKPGLVRVWNDKLEQLSEKSFPEHLDGITIFNGKVYIGVDAWGRPLHDLCRVKVLDLDLNEIETRDIDLGFKIAYGVQTIGHDDKNLYFGCYGGTVRVSPDLKRVERIKFDCSEGFGLVPKTLAKADHPVFFAVRALGGNMQGWRADPFNNSPQLRFDFYDLIDGTFRLRTPTIEEGHFPSPLLSPGVKAYGPLGGKPFPAQRLPVLRASSRACEIAAGEVPGSGTVAIWDGKDASDSAIYIATANTPEGCALIRAFSLDVPKRAQGYAVKAENRRVAIVGFDDVGTIYGAVTFEQMARSGAVAPALVKDWPDVQYRGAISAGRCLYRLTYGEKPADRLSAMKVGIDWMMRQKFNVMGDIYRRIDENSSDTECEFWRDVIEYATERGVRLQYYTTTAVYTESTKPKDQTSKNWPCVYDSRPNRGRESFFCWSEEGLAERAANRFADFLKRIAATNAFVVVHPVDGGGIEDPEMWSRRCARCRARWKDDERWKASVLQFNMWTRVMKEKLPGVELSSCIYPYKFNYLCVPESERTPKFNESTVEYWRHLDEELDSSFGFLSWITSPEVLAATRKLIPNRPLVFNDTYPETPSLFTTCHRKIASCYEEGRVNFANAQGSDVFINLESMMLANEFLWNRKTVGAEAFDGTVYYDGLVDGRGPQAIYEDSLARICYAFWGPSLAMSMARVLSSGMMPEYLKDPAATIALMNKVRANAMYDPTGGGGAGDATRTAIQPIRDTTELMRSQVDAAEECIAVLSNSERLVAGLDRYKRKYFMRFLKYAPWWLATARTRWVVRQADELVAKGKNAEARALLVDGRRQIGEDFAQAELNYAAHRNDPDWLSDRPSKRNCPCGWPFDRMQAERMLSDAEDSASVVLKPRTYGPCIAVGVFESLAGRCIKAYLDRFANVKVEFFSSLSLSELDRFDCVFLPSCPYDKTHFFNNVRAFVQKGGGGVVLEGAVCGHPRFDTQPLFSWLVKGALDYHQNPNRLAILPDGTKDETMYVDYFALQPGPKGDVRAYGPDGKDVLAVRGRAKLGKVFYLGTFSIASVEGTFATCEKPLFGVNARLTREAVEWFARRKLVEK